MLSQNEHLLFENEDIFTVYPTGSDNSFEVDITKSSPFYRSIVKDNKNLVFLLNGLFAENITCHEFNYNGIISHVEISKKEILFCGEKDKKLIKLTRPVEKVKTGNFLFIDYVLIEEKANSCLIAYNPKNNTARTFYADKIEIVDNGFHLQKKLFNYEKIDENYIVDKEGLKLKDKKFFLSENTNRSIETIVYKFMSAVKCGDYNTCLSLCTGSLIQNIDALSLKKYFGQISYFYMLDPYSCFALSNDKNTIYEFSLSGNKISDINNN